MFAEHREVRVTARESCKTPFVAPDQAPVSLLNRELEKGLKGWTDFDVKIEDTGMVDGGAVRAAEAEFEAMTVGTYVRKAPQTTARVRRPRPTTRRWA
ncbi:hypothetical protein PBI_JOSHKAYV_98 [Mycobacterium phage JoshKayV]|uniref:Uncharacterized protein n=1 Tax=Mycobacterium phage JoshKayV TaxID=2024294 RepID=A0A249XU07_9CAUD|nr:hypothetical protein KIY86_gp09 [Mycobacterium phage JoshKayV]ASZ75437.1 hypothetical protein PBI_JOSHKAYV_98 [Mycobacterium phage JoshKayV]